MKYWLHQMESAGGDLENHGIAVLEIHRTIAETSGSPLLRSVTGIVELTLALALKQCQEQGAGDYLSTTLEALTRLVTAIGNADASTSTDIVAEVIDLDECRVKALL